MKNKAINALIEMGMPADIKGFHYIADAMLLFEDISFRNGKITTLYYKIGQMSDVSPTRVERAIRHAFSIVLKDGAPGYVDKYLTRKHTTNGNLLHVLYLRLTQEE